MYLSHRSVCFAAGRNRRGRGDDETRRDQVLGMCVVGAWPASLCQPLSLKEPLQQPPEGDVGAIDHQHVNFSQVCMTAGQWAIRDVMAIQEATIGVTVKTEPSDVVCRDSDDDDDSSTSDDSSSDDSSDLDSDDEKLSLPKVHPPPIAFRLPVFIPCCGMFEGMAKQWREETAPLFVLCGLWL